MAASTESQGSSCSPRAQGRAPSASCWAAIQPTVSRTWSADSTPGSSGRNPDAGSAGDSGALPSRVAVAGRHGHIRAPRDRRLVGVDDQALAEDGVEQPLGGAGQPGAVRQVPDQEPVIGPDGGRVALDPERALETPEGCVQG